MPDILFGLHPNENSLEHRKRSHQRKLLSVCSMFIVFSFLVCWLESGWLSSSAKAAEDRVVRWVGWQHAV